MYVINSSRDMLLNITEMQAYFSVEPIVFKSVKFRDKAQIPFRNKSNKMTVITKMKK